MPHRLPLVCLFLVALLVMLALPDVVGEDSNPLASNTTKKPDIVLIVVDDLNDWVGVMNGHPQSLTPNIDALAQQGIRICAPFFEPVGGLISAKTPRRYCLL